MTGIAAIPTTHAGVRFRSRLEARWAVFLDALSLPWVYEAEAFTLPSGPYCPDFWLPTLAGRNKGTTLGVWLEIKPAGFADDPGRAANYKCGDLAAATKRCAYLAQGEPPGDEIEVYEARNWDEDHATPAWDDGQKFGRCTMCGRPDIEYCGDIGRICPRFDDSPQRSARLILAAQIEGMIDPVEAVDCPRRRALRDAIHHLSRESCKPGLWWPRTPSVAEAADRARVATFWSPSRKAAAR